MFKKARGRAQLHRSKNSYWYRSKSKALPHMHCYVYTIKVLSLFHCALKDAVSSAAQPLLFSFHHSQKCPSAVNQQPITSISPGFPRLHSHVLINAQFNCPFFVLLICSCFSVIQISYSRKDWIFICSPPIFF